MISRDTFCDLAADTPAVIRVVADLDVSIEPLAAYAALTGRTTSPPAAPNAIRVESAEKVATSDPDGAFTAAPGADRHARYSFVGYDPAAAITIHPPTQTSNTATTHPEPADTEVTTDGDSTSSSGSRVDITVLDDRYAGVLSGNGGDTVDTLRAVLPDVPRRNFPETDRQQLHGGLVGFLAYDAVYDLWLADLGYTRPVSRYPDAQFVLATKTLVFDEAADTVSLVFTPLVRPQDDADAIYDALTTERQAVTEALEAAGDLQPGGFHRLAETAGSRASYEQAVEQAKEHVLDGDIYQGVLSRTRELDGTIDPLGLYTALRDINPSPYMYLLDFDDRVVVGASPETLLSVQGRRVVSNPIAGTCDRGSSPVEDRRLAGEMLADSKERAEHTMLVDLARNDVRRVADAGSVRVEEFMNVLKYSHVQHIESTVTGRLHAECDAFDATRAAFPAGTLAGAPKIRAMELIDALEDAPRGIYGGGVGYYSWSGDADFAIVIRTATIDRGAGVDDTDRVTVQAGAGIVADSDPAREYRETEKKMDGVLTALDAIESSQETPGPQGSS